MPIPLEAYWKKTSCGIVPNASKALGSFHAKGLSPSHYWGK